MLRGLRAFSRHSFGWIRYFPVRMYAGKVRREIPVLTIIAQMMYFVKSFKM